MSKRKKLFWKRNYTKKRNTHGEFALLSVCNNFRLSRKQVDEVHNIIDNSKCGPNEQDGCVPCPCPERTCQVPDPKCPDLVCAQACFPFCECKPGYLRDATTKKCVPKSSCPKKGY
ncbi:unnamed protein product [Diabrotica balteata]|uniref:TIL domain-containing protein n=1 Tax=Diabrotica balteata TaxID=107213 RepID=A0A9N9T666_DIABA|nr:unnamed protein product [Diabrotica balteata]